MKEAGKCIHFTGIQNKQCKAGVLYDDFSGGLPCFPLEHLPERPHCEKFLLPTAEQIAESEAEFESHMDRMRTVMAVVSKWRTWTKKSRVAKQEVIECPACKGRLHLSQAAYNGHVWGRCETTGCVDWME